MQQRVGTPRLETPKQKQTKKAKFLGKQKQTSKIIDIDGDGVRFVRFLTSKKKILICNVSFFMLILSLCQKKHII